MVVVGVRVVEALSGGDDELVCRSDVNVDVELVSRAKKLGKVPWFSQARPRRFE